MEVRLERVAELEAPVLGASQEGADVTGRIDDERSPIANLNEIGRVPPGPRPRMG